MSILEVIHGTAGIQIDGTLRTLSTHTYTYPGMPAEIQFIIHNCTTMAWSKSTESGLFYVITLSPQPSSEIMNHERIVPIVSDIPPKKPLLHKLSIDAPVVPGQYLVEINIVNVNQNREGSIKLKRWITSFTVIRYEIPRRTTKIYNQLRNLLIHSK